MCVPLTSENENCNCIYKLPENFPVQAGKIFTNGYCFARNGSMNDRPELGLLDGPTLIHTVLSREASMKAAKQTRSKFSVHNFVNLLPFSGRLCYPRSVGT